MPVIAPFELGDALAALADHPDAIPLAGGTDLMVEINEHHRRLDRPDQTVVALNRVAELRTWTIDRAAGTVTIGAGVTWAEIERGPIAEVVPALAQAARTVGSPQIRSAATIGGNLATCSPAGDGLPVLAALDARVTLAHSTGERSLDVGDFMLGVKRTAIEPGELLTSVTVPILEGFQGYAKVGVRNAMVIATASACVAVDLTNRIVRIALGSVAPTIIHAGASEQLVTDQVDWDSPSLDADTAAAAGASAATACSPITDHRSTATYRRHTIGVLTERLLRRAFPTPQEVRP